MAATKPVVLETTSIQDFLQYLLDHHSPPSTLVVCSSKAAFFKTLQDENNPSTDLFSKPTLRLLSTSRTLTLAFCPDITHLRAYVSALPTVQEEADANALRLPTATPILAILNPIALHRPTSAFSAQGLNRTLAVAVEAAHNAGRNLILSEIPADGEVWDEELPMLNVTTKRLGEVSVGRTVKVRRVLERWFVFEKLER